MWRQKPENIVLPYASNVAKDVVAIAASLGGLKAISEILSALPLDFPAAIVVVQHLRPNNPSHLADILNRRTALIVRWAESGDQLRSRTVYVAPPNKHLLIDKDGTVFLSNLPKVNFVRPCADLLFESVATSFQQRAIAVVLTGSGSDGARSVQAIRKVGGMVLAQSEATCECFRMPSAAIDTGSVNLVLPLNQIAFALETLVMTAAMKPKLR